MKTNQNELFDILQDLTGIIDRLDTCANECSFFEEVSDQYNEACDHILLAQCEVRTIFNIGDSHFRREAQQ
jgi:hypothetical protein